MHTADSLTDAILNKTREEALDVDDVETAWQCHLALHGAPWTRMRARKFVAEHLNNVDEMEKKA
jgi:hypothetical protein